MSRTSDKTSLSHSFYQLFATNPSLLIGMAFDVGMVLGRRTGATVTGKKVRSQVSNLAERIVELAPDSVANLVPDILPSKPRARRKSPGGKTRTAG
ncbi:MAG: hypothetical protein QOF19_1909 [Alphaproteobacteria bacterium]|jgi:hypothetical protein|nr:hypothetical protein [Alphaproteobacteria bacterium]